VIKTARERGFITYLYLIATENPLINLDRVKNRVDRGGHAVPEEKIRDRYRRSMENLSAAFLSADLILIVRGLTRIPCLLASLDDMGCGSIQTGE
jgi:predicted ABC-type ATPase